MLRRLRLPAKLFVAGIPLVVTLAAAAGFLVVDTLAESADVERAADLARSWHALTDVVSAVSAEEAAVLGGGDVAAARATTDEAVRATRAGVETAGRPIPLVRQLGVATAALSGARADTPDDVAAGYARTRERFLEIGALMPSEVSHEGIARDLAAVSAMARAGESASVEARAALHAARTGEEAAYDLVSVSGADREGWLATFEASASGSLLDAYRTSRVPSTMSAADRGLRLALFSESSSVTVSELDGLLDARDAAFAEVQGALVERIAVAADEAAAAAEREAWIVVGVAAAALLLGSLTTAGLARSVVRRIRSLTTRAAEVVDEQLPALVGAIRDPRGATLPELPPLEDAGADEVGDLARSFATLQGALADVAAEQARVLRKGVSDMFVSLARRNRSLVDRQLALLDELEGDEENPVLLAELYRLDHLATRMRRNAESLLVMAGVSSPRARGQAVEVDDVVRAAIGEIEDFRRVDILAVEAVSIAGPAVADLAHLLAELIENAVSFSPPDTRVRVTGHFHHDGYLITISDRGLGIPPERLGELNALLASPPVVGLALEPTLGLFVVSVLAGRHGMRVELVPGAPGTSANILLPSSIFAAPAPSPRHLSAVQASAPHGEGDPVGAGDGRDGVPTAASPGAQPAVTPPRAAAAGTGGEGALPDGRLPTRNPGAAAAPAEGLPVRTPGSSLSSEGNEETGASGASVRDPSDLRAALARFQGGREAARDEEEDR